MLANRVIQLMHAKFYGSKVYGHDVFGWQRRGSHYAKHSSRSHDAVIRVYNNAGNVIETHEHAGEFKEW